MEVWSFVCKAVLLICVLFLMLYDIKINQKLILKARFISPGAGCLFIGSILFVVSDYLAFSYAEQLTIFLMTFGAFVYIYRLVRLTLKLNRLANRDTLTGIANRRSLYRMLSDVKEFNEETSIIFLDIDDFKSINDQYGHQTADEILCCIIGEIRKNLRSTDILSRYGGDEFVIILPKTGKADATVILNRLKESVRKIKNSQGIKVSFSAGIATSPEDGKSLEELINIADKEMYLVKGKSSLGIIS